MIPVNRLPEPFGMALHESEEGWLTPREEGFNYTKTAHLVEIK
jgi:hypothetical protein